ncbi:MAG TPA: winged helix DNA-binding domain-containing protein [Roseiflexaceae bacterium]|nr:winged helix DNA-binding domain-containing protein [Roseiflexaceae bacterium]
MTIAYERLHHQRLAANQLDQPAAVVQWLGAVQAQDYAGAKWSIGMRLRAATDDDVEQAFDQGALLRTHLLRPTWHFVVPEDIHWLLALTAPRVHALNAPYYRKLGLDDALYGRIVDVLTAALRDGKQLTRDELRRMFDQAGIATAGALRMSYMLMRAELDGILCSGPRSGKQFTYMLLKARVPQARQLTREAALAELARRYFLSRGPATVHDFAKWSGLTVADARAGLEAVKSDLRHKQVEGQTYWLPATTEATGTGAPQVYLLSIYDEYLSGYKERSAVIDPDHSARLVALGNDLTAVVVIDGLVVGVWKRRLSSHGVVISVTPFRPLSQEEREAVALAAERYGAFLQLPVSLEV